MGADREAGTDGATSAGAPRWRPTPARVATLLVFALAGLLLVASAVTARGTDLRAARSGDLAGLARQRIDEQGRTRAQVDALAARVGAMTAQERSPGAAAALARLAAAAGLTAVVGPSVQVTLDDAPRPPSGQVMPGNPAPDDLVVHQQDVQAVVNAMWRAGASGVTVMGQRLVSTSAVRCVGNTLLLGGRVYSPPFDVVAVGDQSRIERELDRDPQVSIYREYVDRYGLGYTLRTEAESTLPAYTGPLPASGAGA